MQSPYTALASRTRAALAALFLLPAIAFAQVDLDTKPQTGLPRITLTAGGQSIQADIAATEASRQKGLMHRTKMGKNDGMLFVFRDIGYHAMWMRNTPLNLSVAYMDDKGKILSIHEMDAFTENAHQSAGPARFALEMHAKWFTNNNIKVGDAVRGLEKAPQPK